MRYRIRQQPPLYSHSRIVMKIPVLVGKHIVSHRQNGDFKRQIM